MKIIIISILSSILIVLSLTALIAVNTHVDRNKRLEVSKTVLNGIF